MGGSVLLSAVTTDGWTAARQGFSELLGRGDPMRTGSVRRLLDSTAAEMAAAPPGQRDSVVRHHRVAWSTRLRDFLEESPQSVSALRALVAELAAWSTATPGAPVSAFGTGEVRQLGNTSGINVAVTGTVGGSVCINDG